MKTFLISLMLLSGLAGCAERPNTQFVIQEPTTRCEEDMDCWDCRTMGNRICGPIDTY